MMVMNVLKPLILNRNYSTDSKETNENINIETANMNTANKKYDTEFGFLLSKTNRNSAKTPIVKKTIVTIMVAITNEKTPLEMLSYRDNIIKIVNENEKESGPVEFQINAIINMGLNIKSVLPDSRELLDNIHEKAKEIDELCSTYTKNEGRNNFASNFSDGLSNVKLHTHEVTTLNPQNPIVNKDNIESATKYIFETQYANKKNYTYEVNNMTLSIKDENKIQAESKYINCNYEEIMAKIKRLQEKKELEQKHKESNSDKNKNPKNKRGGNNKAEKSSNTENTEN